MSVSVTTKRNRRVWVLSAAAAAACAGLGQRAHAQVTLSGGTTDVTGAATDGLAAGKIFNASFDQTSANPVNAGTATSVSGTSVIQLGTFRAEDTAANNGTGQNLNGWNDNSTWIYTGQINFLDQGGGTGRITFLKAFDDHIIVKIDGVQVLNNSSVNTQSLGNATATAGFHNIEIRLGEGTGNVGPTGAGGFTGTIGLGIDIQGRGLTNSANFTTIRDNSTNGGSTLQLQTFGAQTNSADVLVTADSILQSLNYSNAYNSLTINAGTTLSVRNGGFRFGSFATSAPGTVGISTLAASTNVAAGFKNDVAVGQLNDGGFGGIVVNKTGTNGDLVFDYTAGPASMTAAGSIAFNVGGGNAIAVGAGGAGNNPLGQAALNFSAGGGNLFLSTTTTAGGATTFDNALTFNNTNSAVVAGQVGGVTVSNASDVYTSFQNTAVANATINLGGSNGVNVTAGNSVGFQSLNGYTLNVLGTIGGAGMVRVSNAGTQLTQNSNVFFNNAAGPNTYAGGTLISAGALTAVTTGSLGTGTVQLTGGTLNLNTNAAAANLVNATGSNALINYNFAGAVGGSTATVGGLAMLLLSTAVTSVGTDTIAATGGATPGIIAFTSTNQTTMLTRGVNLTLAGGAVLSESGAGMLPGSVNRQVGSPTAALGSNADIYFAPRAGVILTGEALTVGAGSPFRGISNERAAGFFGSGTITANSDFNIQMFNGAPLTLGTNGQSFTILAPNGPVNATIAGGTFTFGANSSAAAYNFSPNVTFVASNGATVFVNSSGPSLGTSTTNAALNAKLIAQSGAIVNVNATNALNGDVTINPGGILLVDDNNNLNGIGTITSSAGSITRLGRSSNQAILNNTANTAVSTQAGYLNATAGQIVRLEVADIQFLNEAVNDGSIFEIATPTTYTFNPTKGSTGLTLGNGGVLTISGTNNVTVTNGATAINVGVGGATIVGGSSGGQLTLALGVNAGTNNLQLGSNVPIDSPTARTGLIRFGNTTVGGPAYLAPINAAFVTVTNTTAVLDAGGSLSGTTTVRLSGTNGQFDIRAGQTGNVGDMLNNLNANINITNGRVAQIFANAGADTNTAVVNTVGVNFNILASGTGSTTAPDATITINNAGLNNVVGIARLPSVTLGNNAFLQFNTTTNGTAVFANLNLAGTNATVTSNRDTSGGTVYAYIGNVLTTQAASTLNTADITSNNKGIALVGTLGSNVTVVNTEASGNGARLTSLVRNANSGTINTSFSLGGGGTFVQKSGLATLLADASPGTSGTFIVNGGTLAVQRSIDANLVYNAGTLTFTAGGLTQSVVSAEFDGTYNGSTLTALNAQTLTVNGTSAVSTLTLASGNVYSVGGGQFLRGGSGRVTLTSGDLNVASAGTVSPGKLDDQTGILNANVTAANAVALASGANFTVDINGAGGTANAGLTYDQLNVTGQVALNGATLNVRPNFSDTGSVYTIINNDAADAVVLTNSGFAAVTLAGSAAFFGADTSGKGTQGIYATDPNVDPNAVELYALTYTGGSSGNDVVLTAVPEPVGVGTLGLGLAGLLGRRRRKAKR